MAFALAFTALGVLSTLAFQGVISDSDSAAAPTGFEVVSAEGAEELTVEAIDDAYEYNPEVACPGGVVAEPGATFKCEALVRDRLVPVIFEVVTDLGFIRVIHVG